MKKLFVSHSCPFVVLLFHTFVYFVYFVVHSLLNVRAAEATRGRAQARHPRTTFFPMKKLFVSHSCPFVVLLFHTFVYFVYFVVHSLLNVRAAEATRGRAQARHPRTTFFSLLPSPYFTENKRVVPSSVSCRISRASRSLIESSSSWYWVFSGGVKDSSAKRSLPFRSAIPSLSAGRSSR